MAVALLAGLSGAAYAQDGPTVAITGRVGRSTTLTMDQLRALPQVAVNVPQPVDGPVTARGDPPGGRYAGALLWPLLLAASPLDPPGRRTTLRHTVIAHAQDGASLALEMSEMDPARDNKPVLLATTLDGAPLPAPALVLPGDARTARIVPGLAQVEVR